jgi:hypothetical protein
MKSAPLFQSGRVLALAIALMVSSDCTRGLRVPSPPPTPTAGRPGSGASHCQSVDGFPDPLCTPGAIDARVTQANIHSTICVSGYTATVRPPVSFTNPVKARQIAAYGYSDTSRKDYEEDHLIPLELGGAPADPRNLWPEPGHSPNPKDRVEGKLHRLVCAGKMSLAEAQDRIRTNWKTALE